MIAQYINVAGHKWEILIYYNTSTKDYNRIMDILLLMNLPFKEARKSAKIVSNRINTGLTCSDIDRRISFVCVSNASSISQFVNTVTHELKHVLSHICEYYNVAENSEAAAYLIGHLSEKVYNFLKHYI